VLLEAPHDLREVLSAGSFCPMVEPTSMRTFEAIAVDGGIGPEW